MSGPTLTSTLISQLALQGITIVGDPFLQDGQTMVAIEDSRAEQSLVVPLTSLTGCDNTHFNTPGVFRSEPAVAACSSSNSSPSHDYSLDACYMPTPENLDEILRQIASCDHDQAEAGKTALDYAREQARERGPEALREFERQVEEAKQTIAEEHPEELPRVEETYQQYQNGKYEVPTTSTLPSSSSHGSSSSNPGAVGTGSQEGVGEGAGVEGVVLQGSPSGTLPEGEVDSIGTIFGSGGIVSTAAFADSPVVVNAGSDPVEPEDVNVEGRSNEVPLAGLMSVPALVSPPVTVTVWNATFPAIFGSSRISGNSVQFFQNLFGQGEASSSPIAQALRSSDPRYWFFQEATRDAVSRVLRNFLGSSPSPSGQAALSFRLVPEGHGSGRHGIEISLAPVGRDGRVISDLDDDEEAPTGFGALPAHFASYAPALFSSIRRPSDYVLETATVFVPLLPPSQYMRPSRSLSEGGAGFVARDGAATDRAPSRIAHRGNSSEHRGRGDRNGEDGSESRDNPQEYYPESEDEHVTAAA